MPPITKNDPMAGDSRHQAIGTIHSPKEIVMTILADDTAVPELPTGRTMAQTTIDALYGYLRARGVEDATPAAAQMIIDMTKCHATDREILDALDQLISRCRELFSSPDAETQSRHVAARELNDYIAGLPGTDSPATAEALTPEQADGLACVYPGCGVSYLTGKVPHVPVGRSATGSQVFECSAHHEPALSVVLDAEANLGE